MVVGWKICMKVIKNGQPAQFHVSQTRQTVQMRFHVARKIQVNEIKKYE